MGIQMTETELKELENLITELTHACNTLLAENGQLREENSQLSDQRDKALRERAGLIKNQDEVRTKVETLVTRLKLLEQAA